VTENDGHEMTDQIARHKLAGHEFLGHYNARREIAVHEIIYAGHEIAGQK